VILVCHYYGYFPDSVDVEGTSIAEHFAQPLGSVERVSSKLHLCGAAAFT